MMTMILNLSGYNIQETLYLFKNVSFKDLSYINETFGKEIIEYRVNMANLSGLK